eukprot:m.65700 g.65700  ORF g.65700 m.65700 type:complete len:111 (-) comp11753_c0_seq1:1675-2007(-)
MTNEFIHIVHHAVDVVDAVDVDDAVDHNCVVRGAFRASWQLVVVGDSNNPVAVAYTCCVSDNGYVGAAEHIDGACPTADVGASGCVAFEGEVEVGDDVEYLTSQRFLCLG